MTFLDWLSIGFFTAGALVYFTVSYFLWRRFEGLRDLRSEYEQVFRDALKLRQEAEANIQYSNRIVETAKELIESGKRVH